MFSFNYIVTSLLGCGLLGLSCVPSAAVRVSPISITEAASSTPQVTVVTDVNGKMTKRTVDAPYGISSSVDSETVNGKTVTHASTTPLSAADAERIQAQMTAQMRQMNQQLAAMRREMRQMFADF